MTWGIEPPVDATRSWGARAIYTANGHFDLLHDRQQFANDNQKFHDWLDKKALPALRRKLERRPLVPSYDTVITLTVSEGTIQASPRGSFGYLYIGAWWVDDAAAVV